MRRLLYLERLAFAASLMLGPSAARAADGPDPKLKPPLRDFIGLNVHTVQFKPDLYRPVARLVRDYHGFGWDVGEETDYYPRFPFARNRVDWETLYGGWTKAGYSVDVCLMFDDTPPSKWADLGRDAWAFGFQFARFFGPTGGQKLAEAVEIGNEPGKYDDASYRTLFENAAAGIRRGDPKLLIATCAMYARPSGPYHKDLATVKGLEALYDVISVHSYPELEGYPTWRRSFPEDHRLDFLPKIREVVAWRDANAPGKQVWLTEFGWDATTQPQAKEGDFKGWVGVSDEQQAQYLVRAFFALAEVNLDRAYIYWFNDDDKASVHASSGLTRQYRPKPSFHAMAHLSATLGDYRFRRIVAREPDALVVAEFAHATDPSRTIWAAWSPTGAGRKAKVLLPKVPGTVERAERMPLAAGPADAVPWRITAGGEVEVEIGEAPIYLRLKP